MNLKVAVSFISIICVNAHNLRSNSSATPAIKGRTSDRRNRLLSKRSKYEEKALELIMKECEKEEERQARDDAGEDNKSKKAPSEKTLKLLETSCDETRLREFVETGEYTDYIDITKLVRTDEKDCEKDCEKKGCNGILFDEELRECEKECRDDCKKCVKDCEEDETDPYELEKCIEKCD